MESYGTQYVTRLVAERNDALERLNSLEAEFSAYKQKTAGNVVVALLRDLYRFHVSVTSRGGYGINFTNPGGEDVDYSRCSVDWHAIRDVIGQV